MKQNSIPIPVYGDCDAKQYLDGLFRLLSPNLFDTEYMDAPAAAALIATALETFRVSRNHGRWNKSPILSKLRDHGRQLNLVCAALFDLACNAEYLRGRVTHRSWIYCNRERNTATPDIFAYYSFLKQCPKCCQDLGLEPRIKGAQHKPSSHHIGEITTTAIVFFLMLLAKSGDEPLEVGVISKQSHDVDAIAWRRNLLVLFEIKASPLVTYPIRAKLNEPFTEPGEDGPEEIKQHKLVDVEFRSHDLFLYLANRNQDIPLGSGPIKGIPIWLDL